MDYRHGVGSGTKGSAIFCKRRARRNHRTYRKRWPTYPFPPPARPPHFIVHSPPLRPVIHTHILAHQYTTHKTDAGVAVDTVGEAIEAEDEGAAEDEEGTEEDEEGTEEGTEEEAAVATVAVVGVVVSIVVEEGVEDEEDMVEGGGGGMEGGGHRGRKSLCGISSSSIRG